MILIEFQVIFCQTEIVHKTKQIAKKMMFFVNLSF